MSSKRFHKNKKQLIQDNDNLIPESIIYEDPELNTRIEHSVSKDNIINLVKKKTAPGSIFASILSLISFSSTCSFFLIPYAFSFHLMIPGLVIFILTTLLSYYTLFLLLRIKIERQDITQSYSQLITSILSRYSSILFNCVLIVYYVGISVIYVYIGKELLCSVVQQMIGEHAMNFPKWQLSLIVQGTGFIMLQSMFALISNKNLIMTLHYVIVVFLVLFGIGFNIRLGTHGEYKIRSIDKGDYMQIGNIVSIASLGLTNHLYYSNAIKDISVFSQKRAKSMVVWGNVIELIVYVALNIVVGLKNYDRMGDPLLSYYKDILSFVFQMCYLIIFIFFQFKVANIWNTIIDLLYELFEKNINSHYAIRITFLMIGLFLSNFIAFWFNYNDKSPLTILILISIIGGVCKTILCFIYPIISYLTTFPNTSLLLKFAQICIMVFCCILMGIEVISAIISNTFPS